MKVTFLPLYPMARSLDIKTSLLIMIFVDENVITDEDDTIIAVESARYY